MEAMIVVALIGVMGTIAFNNFNSFAVRARMTEAKTSLSRIYAAEKTYYLEWLSHSACLKNLGALNMEPRRLYFSGFPNPPNVPACGVNNDFLCTAARFDGTPPTGAPDNCDCVNAVTDPDLGTTNGCASFPTQNLNPALALDFTPYALGVTKNAFTAGAIGAIKSGGAFDVWTVNEKKETRHIGFGE